MNVTCESMATRWADPNARPLFKGKLIDSDGCCCAQGDVLRCCGATDAELRRMPQQKADVLVAKALGISRAHAILLRQVNDSTDGCPQDVLTQPEKVLGPHANLWIAFGRHLDSLDANGWAKVDAAWDAAEAAWDAARAAWAAARAAEAAWDAARAADAAWAAWAAGDAARAARAAEAARAAWAAEAARAAWAAARAAAWELIGWSNLDEPFFLRMFFADPAAWVASVEAGGAS